MSACVRLVPLLKTNRISTAAHVILIFGSLDTSCLGVAGKLCSNSVTSDQRCIFDVLARCSSTVQRFKRGIKLCLISTTCATSFAHLCSCANAVHRVQSDCSLSLFQFQQV